jgi:DNA-binding transcriptional MerR regulator
MRSAQVARAAGVNQQTLRYYERRGLLAEPERSPGGHRLYPSEAVTVLRVIKAAQRLGFSLHEVADLLQTGRHRHGHVDAGLHAHAAAKIAEIDARINDLQIIRDTLVVALNAGCDDLVACATTDCCPLPFTDIARSSAAFGRRRGELTSAEARASGLDAAAIVDGTVPDFPTGES